MTGTKIFTNKYFYLSTGAGNNFFTLRKFEEASVSQPYQASTYSRSDQYVKTLSTDYDKAVSKAKDYVNNFNTKNDKDLNLVITDRRELNEIVQRDKEVIAKEKAEKKAKEEFWKKVNAERAERNAQRDLNFAIVCWANFMTRSCRKYDDLQKLADVPELDAEKRITITGELIHWKEYETQWGYVQKGIFLLETGQKVYGSIPTIKQPVYSDYLEEDVMQEVFVEVGSVLEFDAMIEKPKDFDGTMYFFKRPTKGKFLKQVS